MNEFCMIELDKVLHQPIRTKIIAYLAANQSCDFNTIKRLFNLSDGHMTTHMRELLESGYVEVEKRVVAGKPKTVYYITKAGGEAFVKYIAMLREVLMLG